MTRPMQVTQVMNGFPPARETQVTLANWRTDPFHRWAFHHVREVIPSADIPHDPARARPLPKGAENAGLFDADFLERTDTDGITVLHRGKLVFERYSNGMTEETPHILMSVSKSMLGLLVGALKLDVERQVTDILPELRDSAYRGATIRHLLDMRVGIAFDEDYAATSGPIVEYRKSTGWNPLSPGEQPSDLRSFYQNLKGNDGQHWGRFHYVSPNTDLLGWVIERATGRRYADLMSEHVWKPAGAQRSAYITVDRFGAPRCAGGMCVTVRDLARVGQWMIDSPTPWIEDIERNGDPKAWAAGIFVPYFPDMTIHYRSKWYVLHGKAPLLFGVGIHGQNLFVDRRNGIVIAKVSSQVQPMDAKRIALTMQGVAQARQRLAS
jgi:CubicO group peptidase (beta-lactamase class C family)